MNTSNRIIVIEPAVALPVYYYTGPNLELDLPMDFSFSLTEKVEEFSEFDKIKDRGVLGFDLPQTPKNNAIFSNFKAPATLGNLYEPFQVIVNAGGETLPQNWLFIVGFNDSDQTWQLELSENEEFWKQRAENLALCDIEGLQGFTYGQRHVEIQWQTANPWDWENPEDSLIVNYPIVHYGGRVGREEDPWYYEDLRPWVSLHGILHFGFCTCGWLFDTPLKEIPWFNQSLIYILAQDFFRAKTNGSWLNFHATKLGSGYGAPWDTTTPPNTDWANIFSGGITNGTNYGLSIKLCFKIPYIIMEFILGFWLKVRIKVLNADGDPVQYIYLRLQIPHDPLNSDFIPGMPYVWHVCMEEEVQFLPEWQLAVYHTFSDIFYCDDNWIDDNDIQIPFPKDTVVYSIMNGKQMYSDCEYNTKDLLRCDKTFSDLLGGLGHMGFKFWTDYVGKKVYMYPPETTDIYDEPAVEGFLLPSDEAVNITDIVQPNSLVASFPKRDFKRFLRLQFKDAEDSFIKKMGWSKDKQPYSRMVDLGQNLRNEIEVSENPFFEPLINSIWARIPMPFCWDNEDGNLSFDIQPKIMFFFGLGYYKDEETSIPIHWNFAQGGFVYEVPVPIGGQVINDKVAEWQGSNPLQYGPWVKVREAWVYGYRAYDLYTMMLKYNIFNLFLAPEFEFLVYLVGAMRAKMSFRNRLIIEYQGNTFVGQLAEVRDYRPGEEVTTPVIVRPESQLGLCGNLCSYTGTAVGDFFIDIILEDGRHLSKEQNYFQFPYYVSDAWKLQYDLEAWLKECDDMGLYVVQVFGYSLRITNTNIAFYALWGSDDMWGGDITETLFAKAC